MKVKKNNSKTITLPIAVVVLNLIQYESILPGLEILKKNNIYYDIFVPKLSNDERGFREMFDETFKTLKRKNVNPIRISSPKNKYKILFTPYNLNGLISVQADYNVRYQYGFATKPEWGLSYKTNTPYDYILCYSGYDQSFYRAYAETEIVGFLRYANHKISNIVNEEKKKKILYLPTYGELSSIDEIVPILKSLKDKYQINIKLHHGTSFLKNENKRVEVINNTFDNVYTSNDSLEKLIDETDLVLSDRSGAIFDTLYLEKPVVAFSNIKNYFYGNESLLDSLIDEHKIISTSKTNEIEKIIEIGLTDEYRKKQKLLKENLFPVTGDKPLKIFLNFVKNLLSDNVDKKYKLTHHDLFDYENFLEKEIIQLKEINKTILKNEIFNTKQIEKLNTLISEKNEIILKKEEHLNKIYRGKIWRIIKIYFNTRDFLVNKFKNIYKPKNILHNFKFTSAIDKNTTNNGFKNEIDFWDTELSLKGQYSKSISDRLSKTKSKQAWPKILVNYLKNFKKYKPKVLDLGSGPVSQLSYGAFSKQINLECVDPLGNEYIKLLHKYKHKLCYPLKCCSGESLKKIYNENTFDIVWMHNAIDHSQNPQKVIDSVSKILKIGGYFILQMWSYEGKAESYVGLHQHDFFVDKFQNLYLITKHGNQFSKAKLIKNKNLVVIEKPDYTPEAKQWIKIVWKKIK